MRNKTALGYVMLAITVILWGTTFVSTKILLRNISPVEILFSRFLLGYCALWCVYPRREKFTSLKNEILLFAAGATGIVLYFLCENIALTCTLASSVGPLVATSPVITMLLAVWINKDGAITRATVLGCIIGLVGVVFVFLNGADMLEIDPLGDVLALLAGVCWAVYCILLKRITGISSPIVLTRRIFGYGLIAMLPVLCVAFALRKGDASLGAALHAQIQSLAHAYTQPEVFGNLLFLGLGASAMCYVLWNAAVHMVGVVRAANCLYFVPVATLIAAGIVLREKITWHAILGTALIIGGVYLADRAGRQKNG